MYAFHASEPDSRPPPVSFSPPKAPPISAPDGPMLTFAIPQSDPSAAGPLPPPEGPADLRPGRPDVDVRDSAVRPVRGDEPLRLAHVHREDRRRETLRDIVVHRECLVEVVVGQHVQNGREGLRLH